jgi:hypothetical protein
LGTVFEQTPDTVLWEGKSDYRLRSILGLLFVAVFFLALFLWNLYLHPDETVLFLIPYLLFVVWLPIFAKYGNVTYQVTNQKIVRQQSLWFIKRKYEIPLILLYVSYMKIRWNRFLILPFTNGEKIVFWLHKSEVESVRQIIIQAYNKLVTQSLPS